MSPLTKTGKKVLSNYQKQYGKEKGKSFFYASMRNNPKSTKKWHVTSVRTHTRKTKRGRALVRKHKRVCPGSKIRSKGKGRGLGIGMGRGPIGRHKTKRRDVGALAAKHSKPSARLEPLGKNIFYEGVTDRYFKKDNGGYTPLMIASQPKVFYDLTPSYGRASVRGGWSKPTKAQLPHGKNKPGKEMDELMFEITKPKEGLDLVRTLDKPDLTKRKANETSKPEKQKYPFGMTGDQWEQFADSLKDEEGIYHIPGFPRDKLKTKRSSVYNSYGNIKSKKLAEKIADETGLSVVKSMYGGYMLE